MSEPPPSPFSATAPDVDFTIRCRDGVELHTNFAMLARASDHFADMAIVGQARPQERFITVPDDSRIWDRLLRWMDIRCMPFDESLDDFSIIVDPVRRLNSDVVKARVVKALGRLLKESPKDCFRIWALAIRLHDQPLAAAAARASVGFDEDENDRVLNGEYEYVTAADGLKLRAYRDNVRQKVASFAHQSGLGRDIHLAAFWTNDLTYVPINAGLGEAYKDTMRTTDTSNHSARGCTWLPQEPKLTEEVSLGDIDFSQYRKWFWMYLGRLPDALRRHPSKETIAGLPKFAEEALKEAGKCKDCRDIAPFRLIEFNKKFGERLEKYIDTVGPMPLFTDAY